MIVGDNPFPNHQSEPLERFERGGRDIHHSKLGQRSGHWIVTHTVDIYFWNACNFTWRERFRRLEWTGRMFYHIKAENKATSWCSRSMDSCSECDSSLHSHHAMWFLKKSSLGDLVMDSHDIVSLKLKYPHGIYWKCKFILSCDAESAFFWKRKSSHFSVFSSKISRIRSSLLFNFLNLSHRKDVS